tara:strand:- start:151092 stop:151235 length:144 start_codon:yes stop_codon:yes gene_type:complete
LPCFSEIFLTYLANLFGILTLKVWKVKLLVLVLVDISIGDEAALPAM